jgi:hypothetical protein
VARLYDQKGKMISAHDNLNRLRVKIAKQKDVSLAKLPPCEASLFQKMRMWCRNLLKHALQEITCIQEDPGYGKYHGLEDSDDHPLFL